MDNLPGEKNCHFLYLFDDEVWPQGISIDPDKYFDDEAQWKYLEDLLQEETNNKTFDQVKFAHHKLPELFKWIKTETKTKITYPFKYDCLTGKYLCSELEENLRKNITKGNGKARATGFAIPILGRLPKIYGLMYTY
jgi:hypothetical protein